MHIQAGSYKRIEPTKKSFLGERAQKNGNVAGDLRCKLCGRWYSWSGFNKARYEYENRWDYERNEPKHCGSTHCFDYESRYQVHLAKMANDPSYHAEMSFKIWQRKEKERELASQNLFGSLKRKGMVK